MKGDYIAVILAAYNGEKWIKEQIDSIIFQSNVEVTIFVSCDISTDGTMNIIKTYPNDKVVLLPYGEKFGAAAPNFYRLLRDVDFSKYEYVALADQDDIWFEDKLYSATSKLRKENAMGYSSNVTAWWSDGEKKNVLKATPQRKYDFLFESPGPGCSFVMHADFVSEFQNYIKDKSVLLKRLDWHDWLLYAYARSRNYKWIIDSESHMLYRQHSDNQLGANLGKAQFFKRLNDIISGYGIQQTTGTIRFLNMENDPFVRKWLNKGRKGYLYLSLKSRWCRRRIKDQILFLFSCIIMMIKNIDMERK